MCDLVEEFIHSQHKQNSITNPTPTLSLSLYHFQRFLHQTSRCVFLCLQSLQIYPKYPFTCFDFFSLFLTFSSISIKGISGVSEQTLVLTQRERERIIEQLMGKKRK